MSAKETTQKNSIYTGPRMKDGEEPTEVLLALVSSPLLTLLKNSGLVKIMTAKSEKGQPVVLAVFDQAVWNPSVGILLAEEVPTDQKVLAVKE